MFRLLTSIASPSGSRARLLTFFFHRVLAAPDPMQPGEPDAAAFGRTLGWIKDQFHVLRGADACDRLASGALPERAALLTFDDGYRDNHDVAAPVLARHGMYATFFVATGFLNGGMQFNDRVRESLRAFGRDALDAGWLGLGVLDTSTTSAKLAALEALLGRIKYMLPAQRLDAVARIEHACDFSMADFVRSNRPMMTDTEVRALADSGMEIGGHTRHHPILRTLDDAAARAEIEGGRADLNDIVGKPPELFAYPNGKLGGDFVAAHCELVRRAGFFFAFSTHRGAASARSDHYMLPRYMPWQTSSMRFKASALRVVAGGELLKHRRPRRGESIAEGVSDGYGGERRGGREI